MSDELTGVTGSVDLPDEDDSGTGDSTENIIILETEEERLEKIAVEMRKDIRKQIDRNTDAIFEKGIAWGGYIWYADKVHLDDYKDACQQIMLGLETEVLVHGTDSAYVMLNATNVNDFYNTGKKFKLDTLNDGYKMKDLGGTLSDGITVVKALKDMDYYELAYWADPRII